MNISELREAFKSASGFSFWENSEVDKAIENGMEFLDSKITSKKRDQRVFRELRTGEYGVVFPTRCRVLREVWLITSDGKYKLERGDREDSLPLVMDIGTPSYYYVSVAEPYEQKMNQMKIPANFADILFNIGKGRGILFDVKAERDFIVDITGRFNILPLSDVYKENWWSVNYPDLVVKAAMYRLDIDRRNSSGGMELYNPIMDDIKEINNDSIEEEIEDDDLVLGG